MRFRNSLACVGLLAIPALLGMAQDPESPAKPDAPLYSTAANPNVTGADATATIAADTRPLTGAQPFSLGISGHKQMSVSLFASEGWDSNPGVIAGTGTAFESLTIAGGSLALQRQLQTSQTALAYSGSVVHYSTSQPAFSTSQNLSFSQNFQIGRWNLTGADAFTYTPNSLMGGGFLLPIPEQVPDAVIKPQYAPNQSILNPYGAQYGNTVMGQVAYDLSRRSTWTASAIYGIERFQDFSLYDYNEITGTSGYNYGLTSKDSIGISYNYSLFRYDNFNSQFHSQGLQLSYGRKIGGRMSFQASGGPQFINSGGLTKAANQITYNGSASLDYQRARTSVSISYFTGTTAGAGVLYGATTSTAQVSVSRPLGTTWSATGIFGYSRNSDLTNTSQIYQGLFVGANVHRSLGRYAGLTLNYNYQRQVSDNCVGLACGDLNRQIAGVAFNWSFRPIPLE
ncbi:MAG TPA: hypothetical protein VKW78_08920 [Terriglobales bacterium]|nr:hypothetical protein [Terriglobales bacterium]